ncbi:flagellar basal body-associated protein FliL [Erwinia aphidicola]|uniref:flagellar basal body-associated protein FliL n=1 Tax=Erwinia aphidicola TaxID=68334 RepID=UPI00300C9B16
MSNKNKKAAGGRSGRLLLMILMFIVMIAACGFSGYLFWEMKKLQANPVNPANTDGTAAVKKPVDAEPLYQSLSTFTVSLKPTEKESDRVLFVGVSLRMADKHSMLILEKFLPEYRSRLLILLSKLSYEELSTNEGKQQLMDKIKDEVSKPLASKQAVSVTDVLFNEFILR